MVKQMFHEIRRRLVGCGDTTGIQQYSVSGWHHYKQDVTNKVALMPSPSEMMMLCSSGGRGTCRQMPRTESFHGIHAADSVAPVLRNHRIHS